MAKLKTLYNNLEDGKLTRDEFPYKVEQEVGVKWNIKANKYLEKKSAKDSNFTNLVKVRDFIKINSFPTSNSSN